MRPTCSHDWLSVSRFAAFKPQRYEIKVTFVTFSCRISQIFGGNGNTHYLCTQKAQLYRSILRQKCKGLKMTNDMKRIVFRTTALMAAMMMKMTERDGEKQKARM